MDEKESVEKEADEERGFACVYVYTYAIIVWGLPSPLPLILHLAALYYPHRNVSLRLK